MQGFSNSKSNFMSIPRRGKEKQQDYHPRNTPADADESRSNRELEEEDIEEPVLDEEDLEENELDDEDVDNIEWDEPTKERSSDRGFSGNEERDITV